MDDIKGTPAYIDAKKAATNKIIMFDGRKVDTPEYVKKQASEFLKVADGKSDKYTISTNKYSQIETILKILVMPKGLKAGQSVYDCTTDYQWLFYTAVLCTVYKDNKSKRRYETAILEIARKNFKTYTIAIIFIILFLTEPKFSKFYSVAPDGSLSREVREAIAETLRSSPVIYEAKSSKRFKILRDYIEFLPTSIKYTPLNYTNSKFDGKLPSVFLADEVGALPNSYAIEAMRSGQINILNKLGCIVSTKYPTAENPFEDEITYSKQVLDGQIEDETVFALLYEPKSSKNWETDDEVMIQANPVAINDQMIWEDLLKKRNRAIAMESARENFLTKHCNIIYQAKAESFIQMALVQKCSTPKIDWNGREVYIGVDLSMTNDNTAVSMVSVDDDNNILCNVHYFIPSGRIDEKNAFEHTDYRIFIRKGVCTACGDLTIDYSVVEDYVFGLEKQYGVSIFAIGYDRYNAMSSAQKWNEKYTTVEIRQHSDTLHPPTKLIDERISDGKFKFEENKLLEQDFQNARCTYDTNMNRYVNKKKSNGKIDGLVATIDAVYLLQQDVIFGDDGFVAQVI